MKSVAILKSRIFLVAAISLLIVSVGLFILRPSSSHSGLLMTAPVVRGDIEQSVLASGEVRPASLVAVGSQASGRIISLKVAIGAYVKKGELLAQIDPVPQMNALETARSTVANLRAERREKEAAVALDELVLQRQRRNLEQKATSRADFESARATLEEAQAQSEALDAQIHAQLVAIRTAEVNLGYTHITAPIDGTVLALVSQEGQTVNAVQSAPTILILGRLDVMRIRAEISEADIVKISLGQPLYFTIVGDSESKYHANIESIDPAPDSITSDSSFSAASASGSSASSPASSAIYYHAGFNVPNPQRRLRTYMTAEIHIILGEALGVLTVPSNAVMRTPEGHHVVQVLDAKGRTALREIELGLDNRTSAEIRSGLKEGERVITGKLPSDGQRSAAGPPGPFGPPPMGS